jgi:hypothetical protein
MYQSEPGAPLNRFIYESVAWVKGDRHRWEIQIVKPIPEQSLTIVYDAAVVFSLECTSADEVWFGQAEQGDQIK